MIAKRNFLNARSGVILTPITRSARPQPQALGTGTLRYDSFRAPGSPRPELGGRRRLPLHETTLGRNEVTKRNYENKATFSGGSRTRTASALWALPRASQCLRSFRDDGGRCEKNIPARP